MVRNIHRKFSEMIIHTDITNKSYLSIVYFFVLFFYENIRLRKSINVYVMLIMYFQYSLYPHHSYLNISLTVLLGMYLFFLIERFLKIFMDSKARRQGTLDFGHTHSHQQQTEQEDQVKLSVSLYTLL